MGLFKETAKKARRVFRVENLNSEKGISSSLQVSKNQKKYTVCLCLVDKTIKTTFPSEFSALGQLAKYRQLYKAIPNKK